MLAGAGPAWAVWVDKRPEAVGVGTKAAVAAGSTEPAVLVGSTQAAVECTQALGRKQD